MKTSLQIFFCLLLFSMVACKEDEMHATQNEVDLFMDGLQSGAYKDAMELPAFTVESIPALLKYRNNTERISQFPVNPVSSMRSPDCTLGIYALWIIESIRESNVQSGDQPLIGRFPSLNPRLATQGPDGVVLEEIDISQATAASAYFSWWERSQNISIFDLMEINPLEETVYRWF